MSRKREMRPGVDRATIWRLAPLALLALVSSGIAHATNTALPWESGLSVFMKSISGPVAGIVSVLAICVCGGLLAMGAELNDIVKRTAQVVLAIGICTGASIAFVDLFTNNQATTTGAIIAEEAGQ